MAGGKRRYRKEYVVSSREAMRKKRQAEKDVIEKSCCFKERRLMIKKRQAKETL